MIYTLEGNGVAVGLGMTVGNRVSAGVGVTVDPGISARAVSVPCRSGVAEVLGEKPTSSGGSMIERSRINTCEICQLALSRRFGMIITMPAATKTSTKMTISALFTLTDMKKIIS